MYGLEIYVLWIPGWMNSVRGPNASVIDGFERVCRAAGWSVRRTVDGRVNKNA